MSKSEVTPLKFESIRYDDVNDRVYVIDQTQLPHQFVERELHDLDGTCEAISAMRVRGAPLIGVTAAFGVYLALRNPAMASRTTLDEAVERLAATRPTAINLQWALNKMVEELAGSGDDELGPNALAIALRLHAEDIAACARLGDYGATLLQSLWVEKCRAAQQAGEAEPGQLNVLTHCNAGSLATVDWGTALAVIYKAQEQGLPIHVWVDETRPRNQGASLTAWELARRGVKHTLIVDNAGGHLMQLGLVDCCIVGSDRTTRRGDVCNKIGTYLKALAARDNGVPFYVALPVSTIDFSLLDGMSEIPIEERASDEVTHMTGRDAEGVERTIRLTPENTPVSNFGFDVTPANLVSALITEYGVIEANEEALAELRLKLSE